MFSRRDDDVVYISPEKEVNIGLWILFAGATIFLGLRLWCKFTRRTGLWYDDYILMLSWLVLMGNNILISCQWALGYNTGSWDDRMHILINISSCGTLIGQAWSKTAFGVTLLRMSDGKQQAILWFCIITMNAYMFVKVLFQWAKYCGKDDYQQWYRLQGFCINYNFEQDFKEGGNVYNIIMDFIFALFPWWITWRLEMRRAEKIGLCGTLSLGMIVAIVSAVRTSWKDGAIMHLHDEWYMWRNGMSSIWYSSEVAGTIIVQCIPILRPFLRDIHTSLTSRKIGDTEDGRTSTWRSTINESKRGSANLNLHNSRHSHDNKKLSIPEVIALSDIPEEPRDAEAHARKLSCSSESATPSERETEHATPTTTSGPLFGDIWRLSGSERGEIYSAQSGHWMELEHEQDEKKGLSPPPQHRGPRS